MKQIKRWLNSQKEQSKERQRQEIANCFQVRETEQSLCIVHNGDVIVDFPENATIAVVMKELKNKRETALKYARI